MNDLTNRAFEFLNQARVLFVTGEFKIERRLENLQFEKRFGLRHEQKKEMLLALIPEDCFSIEPNDNLRYKDAMVYKFKHTYDINSYGEIERVTAYIKMYLDEEKAYNTVIVISLHEDNLR